MPESVPTKFYGQSAAQQLKIPPHSVEAEQALLAGLLQENRAWDQIVSVVTEDDFYRPEHKFIFLSIAELEKTEKPIDVIAVSEQLKSSGQLEKIGGLAYLAELCREIPGAVNVYHWALIVREKSILRQLIEVGSTLSESAFDPQGRSSAELLDEAEKVVFEIAEKGSRAKSEGMGIRTYLAKALDRIERMFEQEGSITGVATGFHDFDQMTSGLQAGDMVIIAGRPSMGKTSFAMNIAEHAAISDGVPVAIFSLEMPGEQLVMRMMSSLGRINQHNVRSGKLEEDDWPRLTSAMQMLESTKIFIDDTGGLSPMEIRSRARRIKREHGLGLIVIDYLQLMQIPGRSENRTNEISEISRNLKALAKELEVPVIALSQLNRSLEQRPNKRPIMSDLRESGAIEQDADLIAFIYRDEVYDEDSPDKGIAEIIIGKQRNGPIGTVRLPFLGPYTRFENFAPNVSIGHGD